MAKYKDAIFWLAANDDNEWIADPYGSTSVAACLVADLFNRSEEQVKADIIRETTRQAPEEKRLTSADIELTVD